MSARLRALAATGLIAGLAVVLVPSPASAATFTVTTTDDTVDVAPGDGACADAGGDCSLRAAIQEANAFAGADIITLGAAIYPLDIAGVAEEAAATGDLDVTSEITVDAAGATIDASALGDRIFDVKAGATLTLDGGTLTGGTAADVPTASGGAVLNAGTFTATNFATFTNNSANRAGGAIEGSTGSTTTLSAVLLDSNHTGASPGNGGGLHLTGTGTVDITSSVVTGNTAANEGGGLWNSSAGAMTVTDTTIDTNTAAGPTAANGGGGIFMQPNMTNDGGGTVTITDSLITSNEATGAAGSGGGILNSRGTLTVSGTAITGNTAQRAGGGIEVIAGITTITDGTLSGNNAGANPGNGGGLHISEAGTVDITGTTIDGNFAVEGGGLWNSAVGTLTVTDADITGNTASGAGADQGGGGIYSETDGMGGGGLLDISGGQISENDATGASGSGGGILSNGADTTLTDLIVDTNTAQRAGGGIEVVGGTTTLTDSVLSSNTTGPNPGNGGGLHVTGAGTVDVTGSQISDNSAANEGGGLWNSATGTMSVSKSFLFNNSASGEAVDSGGGGLYNDGGQLDVENTIVIGNEATSAGGGVLDANDGDTALIHVTVTENDAPNGSGVATTVAAQTITLANSIVSGDTGGDDCLGNVVSLGGNVVGSCDIAGDGDVTGVDDPDLADDLTPNPTSPAIDAGLLGNGLADDINGTPRPIDGDGDGEALPDAGAVEAAAVDVVPPDTTTSTTSTTSTTTTTSTAPTSTAPTSSSTTATPITPSTTPSTARPGVGGTDGGTGPGGTVQGPGNGQDTGTGQDAGTGSGQSSLPRTGSNTNVLVTLGLGLLALGGAVLVLRRRNLALARARS